MSLKCKEIDIIKAALKIFSEKGFYDAKIVDIANEAGIGKGTVYEYFKSKEELFKEIIKYSLNKYKNNLENIIEENKSIENTLSSICRFHGYFIAENKNMALALMSNTINISTDMILWIAQKKLEISKLIQELLEKTENNGFRIEMDIEAATYTFIGAINQYYAKKIYFDNISYKDIAPKPLLDIILNGLKQQ